MSTVNREGLFEQQLLELGVLPTYTKEKEEEEHTKKYIDKYIYPFDDDGEVLF